jgi:hypothetical protein
MADRILLRGGHVVTVDPQLGDIAGGDVLIEGDAIAQVGTGLSADAEVIDATGNIVIPGFVDSLPSAHVGTRDPQLRTERHPRRLPRRGAGQLRAAVRARPRGRSRRHPRAGTTGRLVQMQDIVEVAVLMLENPSIAGAEFRVDAGWSSPVLTP